MKAIIVIAIMLWSTANVFAQNAIYFNKTFWNDTMNILSMVAKPIQGGYLSLGSYSTLNNRYFYVRKIDLNGNTIWMKQIDNESNAELDVIESGKQAVITDDNHLIVVYAKDTISNTGIKDNVYLNKFDLGGNKLWSQRYGDNEANEVIRHVLPTQDKGFILAGTRKYPAYPSAIYLIKTDSLGVLEWDSTYAHQWGQAFTVQQTWWDGGYIVGGYAKTDTTMYDMWAIKLTASGEVEWERNYGGLGNDGPAFVVPVTSPEEYANGAAIEYLLLGNRETNLDSYVYRPCLFRLDESGDIIWQNTAYYFSNYLAWFSTLPILYPDDSFLVPVTYTTNTGVANKLLKIDSSGGIVWAQKLVIDYDVPYDSDEQYLTDLQATPDGGVVLAGYQFSPAPQKSWVVKADSLGHTCSYLGCDSTATVIDNINTPPLSGQVFTLSPNPATTQATLYIAQPAAGRQLRIYNMSGQQVKNLVLPDYIVQYHFSVADLPAGVYVCKVGDALGQKLVVGK